jgi:hypothetical protein
VSRDAFLRRLRDLTEDTEQTRADGR